MGFLLLHCGQIITMEGWSAIMYRAMDAIGGGASLIFVALVVVGGFFLLNLILAVLEGHITQAK